MWKPLHEGKLVPWELVQAFVRSCQRRMGRCPAPDKPRNSSSTWRRFEGGVHNEAAGQSG